MSKGKRNIQAEIDAVKQEISNTVFTIGDKYYGIRQFEQEIPLLNKKVDELINKVRALEKENGSKSA